MNEYQIIRIEKPACDKYRSELVQLLLANMHAHAYMDSFSEEDAKKKLIEMSTYIGSDMAIVFGCINEADKLVGFIWAYRHTFREENRMYVSLVQVSEAYRGNGIGAKLLACIENEALRNGLSAIYIHTDANNGGAIRLYEREGFVIERVQLRKSISEGKHDE